jgi:hypothetical protein
MNRGAKISIEIRRPGFDLSRLPFHQTGKQTGRSRQFIELPLLHYLALILTNWPKVLLLAGLSATAPW